MSINRWAARTDANKTAIVAALIADGCSVYDLKRPVDLLIGVPAVPNASGFTLLMEVKDGDKSPSRRKLTKGQRSFMETWLGGAVATVTDVDSALRAVASARSGQ